jgi:hypothetical protein
MIQQYQNDMLEYDDSKPKPMPSTDMHDVVASQLTENTGRHMLDSGSHYGRHWEENRDNPPWEQPEWVVNDGWVTHNLYHYMTEEFSRDERCFALEASLYAYAIDGGGEGMSWLAAMEEWAEMVVSGSVPTEEQQSSGITEDVLETLYAIPHECEDRVWTQNTYNGNGTHTLSQDYQSVHLGDSMCPYTLLQVHGGCDIRGGYTAPRVYCGSMDSFPMELVFFSTSSEWQEAESVLYDDDTLVYQPRIDAELLSEQSRPLVRDIYPDDEVQMMAQHAADEARGHDDVDGAVFRAGRHSIEHVLFG